MTFHRLAAEQGSVTAEFAVAVPAIVLVLAISVAGVGASVQSVRLQGAASAAAREAGRGDGIAVVGRLVPGATALRWSEGDLECVRLSAAAAFGPVVFPLSAEACALGGGE